MRHVPLIITLINLTIQESFGTHIISAASYFALDCSLLLRLIS